MADRKSKDGEHASDQHARFLETARALGCAEDEAAFDEKLKAVVVVRSGPQTQPNEETTPSKKPGV